jgi:hypothetical protein
MKFFFVPHQTMQPLGHQEAEKLVENGAREVIDDRCEATKLCPGGGAPSLLPIISEILNPAFAACAINKCEFTQLRAKVDVPAWL